MLSSVEATSLGSVEATAAALGRLDFAMRGAPESVRAAAVARFARTVLEDGDVGTMLAPHPSAAPTLPTRYHDALRRIADGAGGDDAQRIASLVAHADAGSSVPGAPNTLANALADVLSSPMAAASGLAAAAMAAGLIVRPAPMSRAAVHAAALGAAAILVTRGLIGGPWVSTVRLDAYGRSAAVQLERSGQWGPWLDAFCRALTREAEAVRRAANAVIEAFAAERQRVRATRRVGATDEAVLAYLQAEPHLTIADASRALGLTVPTVGTAISRLEAASLAVEVTGRRRDRAWIASGVYAFAAG